LLHDKSKKYIRFCEFGADPNKLSYVVIFSDHGVEIFAEAISLLVDVTFPSTKGFKYLMNVTSLNIVTMRYEVVARVLLN
jgi:hypothetical protein